MEFNLGDFSYRLGVLLDEKNMKQKELAKRVGTTNVTICRYLNGERIPRLDVVAKIADVFNVSLDYLLCLSNDKDIKNSVDNSNINITITKLVTKLFSLNDKDDLSKQQIEAIKKLLLANKDFILSA